MNHEQFQELMNRYLDEGLNDGPSAQMFEHLGACSDCRNFMRSSMRIRSYYLQQEPKEVPASLDRRIAESVEMIPATVQRRQFLAPFWTARLSVPVPVAASILFLILVGSLLFSPLFYLEQKHTAQDQSEIVSSMPPGLQQQLQHLR